MFSPIVSAPLTWGGVRSPPPLTPRPAPAGVVGVRCVVLLDEGVRGFFERGAVLVSPPVEVSLPS